MKCQGWGKMDERRMRELIAGGESMTAEFKGEATRPLSDAEIVETVVCLANLPAAFDGGVLLIGVENDGRITGARPWPRKGDGINPDRLQAMIFANTEPPLETDVTVIGVAEGAVIAIAVARRNDIFATKQGLAKRRALTIDGPQCVPFYPHEHQSHRSDLGLVDVSAQTLDALDWRALDPLEIERLRQTVARRGGDQALVDLDDDQLAKALGLVETRGGRLVPNVAGLLILGRQEVLGSSIPSHAVEFQALGPEGEVRVNDSLRGPLLRTLEEVEQRFAARNSEQEVAVGLFRLPIPDYSSDAFAKRSTTRSFIGTTATTIRSTFSGTPTGC